MIVFLSELNKNILVYNCIYKEHYELAYLCSTLLIQAHTVSQVQILLTAHVVKESLCLE